jgi:hypothetical protein
MLGEDFFRSGDGFRLIGRVKVHGSEFLAVALPEDFVHLHAGLKLESQKRPPTRQTISRSPVDHPKRRGGFSGSIASVRSSQSDDRFTPHVRHQIGGRNLSRWATTRPGLLKHSFARQAAASRAELYVRAD